MEEIIEEEDKQTFMEYIGDNYYSVKTKLSDICKGFNSILFDEDVFHDTIIKIDGKLLKDRFSRDLFEKYMCKSFRTNLVREKMYHRNSMTDYVCSFNGIEPYTMPYVLQTIDFKIVISTLDKKFGHSYTRAYVDWLSGFPIGELGIDSPYYHIRKMTEYIRSYKTNNEHLY